MHRPLLLAATLAGASAQQPGFGIAKYTMSVSDPLSALDWAFAAGWPLLDCRTPGDSGQCNGTDTCGLIGRTSLCPNDACVDGGLAPGPPNSFMFPHMVNASSRPYDDLSIEETERQFTAKLSAAFASSASSGGGYDPFLDFSLVVYAASLEPWIAGVDNATDAKSWLALRWIDNANATWYSAIFHIPRTQVLVEVISDAAPSARVVPPGELVDDPLMRYPATGSCAYNACAAKAGNRTWVPLAVSKAVSDLDRVDEWYRGVLRAELASSDEGTVEGVRLRTYYFPKQASMQVRLVERAPRATLADTMSVAEFEAAKFRAHDRALGRTEQESALCGVSKWYDNHWGIDQSVVKLDEYIDAMRARNWTYYHLWSWNMYAVDPSGDAIQLDADWGGDKPAWAALSEDDSLQNLCTQGNCSVANAPSPTSETCAAALASECPLGGFATANDCADCIHWRWAALTAAGCFNIDVVSFCEGL